jgi:ABC-type branched-subunit amino acid transport system substrate-binding protein
MIQRDSIFRLTPHDYVIGKVIAYVVEDYGIEQMTIIERDDMWASGIGDWFVGEYEELGGVVLGRVKYNPELASGFSKYLAEADTMIEERSIEKTGVLLLSFGETNEILNESDAYPFLVNATWFSTDINNNIIGQDTTHPRISPLYIPVLDEETASIAVEFEDRFGDELEFYDANIYDSCMIMGLSVIETGSNNANLVEEALPSVAMDYVGLTGPCGLDEYRDRLYFTRGLFTIGYEPGFEWKIIGYYQSPSNQITWSKTD